MKKQRSAYVDPRPTVTLGDGEEAYAGDFVRIGEGTGHLWKIESFGGEGQVDLLDEVTGRKRKALARNLNLSFHA